MLNQVEKTLLKYLAIYTQFKSDRRSIPLSYLEMGLRVINIR